MIESIPISPLTTRYGCGIYEVDTGRDDTYVKLFVTDTGWVLPVNHRVLNEQDLLDAYVVGRVDGQNELTGEKALKFLADNAMESGLEIGEAVERLRGAQNQDSRPEGSDAG